MAALKFGFMVCDRYFVEDDYFSIGGYSVLFDMDGFSTKHMAGLTVPTLRYLLVFRAETSDSMAYHFYQITGNWLNV